MTAAGFFMAVPSPALAQDAPDEDAFFKQLIDSGEQDRRPRWNHLEPGKPWDGGFESYESKVTGFLHEAFGEDVVLRVVVYPSFHPEYVIGIREGAGGATLFRMQPAMQLWGYPMMDLLASGAIVEVRADGEHKADDLLVELKERYPDMPNKIAMIRCERPLDPGLVARIRAVWKAMILDARPPPGLSLGNDGVTYHFSMPLAGGIPAQAHIWSPPRASRTGQLVGIAERMERYCAAGDADTGRDALETAVADLAAELDGMEAAAAP